MQIINGFQAVRNPCYSCSDRQPEYVCVGDCEPLNHYLVSIGEMPHFPVSKIPLYKQYPPGSVAKLKGLKIQRCTEAQFKAMRKQLTKLKKQLNLTGADLARSLGLAPETINKIIRKQSGKKSVTKWNYKIISEWIKENEQ